MDVPDVPEDYVHRIGRTGRAGAEGDAFILVSREEEGSLARIERQVGQRLPRVTLPDFDYRQSPPPLPSSHAEPRHGRGPTKSVHKGPPRQQQGKRSGKPHGEPRWGKGKLRRPGR
jgi:ATP-dependent RNA helicase RhlE